MAQNSAAGTREEFEEFKADTAITHISSSSALTPHAKKASSENISWTIGVLFLTAMAGVMTRFKATRHLRPLFLVLSVVILGFYHGGCPCSIQSLQHGILLLSGVGVRWQSVLLFAALIPLTYLFGRVYCGWICQLGAFQEFLFKTSSSIKIFHSSRAQKIMRIIRTVALVVLIVQLLLTKTNLYKNIDPFTTIYNFYPPHLTVWILIGLVVLSSLFMYRPFCKTICPVGLMLGWISKVPGASILGIKQNCISCVKCNKTCRIKAITHDTRYSVLDNQECIRCGTCMDECVKDSIGFFRKSRNHLSTVACKPS